MQTVIRMLGAMGEQITSNYLPQVRYYDSNISKRKSLKHPHSISIIITAPPSYYHFLFCLCFRCPKSTTFASRRNGRDLSRHLAGRTWYRKGCRRLSGIPGQPDPTNGCDILPFCETLECHSIGNMYMEVYKIKPTCSAPARVLKDTTISPFSCESITSNWPVV